MKTVIRNRAPVQAPAAAVLATWLSSVVLATLLTVHGSSPANAAIGLSEFDALEPERQAKVLSAVLDAYHDYYKSSPQTREFRACVKALYEPVSEGGAPRLLPLVLKNIDFARADATRRHTIEGLVQGVIELQCPEQ
jgi:hypothetical protein